MHKYGNMVSHMKTTVDLDDDLLIRAKQRAAALRKPLRELIERGLRRELAQGKAAKAPRRARIAWVTAPGGVPPDLDVSSREAMTDWITKRR